MITIYHNGTCSKCRGALEMLQEQGIPHEVRWYMAEPLSAGELKELLQKLRLPIEELLRKGEEYFIEHFQDKDLSEEEWLEVLARHPELLQRPIVVNGNNAVIARPPERLAEVL
jgi:arsenate reductase